MGYDEDMSDDSQSEACTTPERLRMSREVEACKRDEVPRDVVIRVAGHAWYLHSRLLGYHSKFFEAAFSQSCCFKEAEDKMMELQLDPHAAPAWPILLEYMYDSMDVQTLSNSNALAFLCLARQLIIPHVELSCRNFMLQHLQPDNCLELLYKVTQSMDPDLQRVCVDVAAQHFGVVCCDRAAGLPPDAVLDILKHPMLEAQSECQVLEFLCSYLSSTVLDSCTVQALLDQVRWAFVPAEWFVRMVEALEPLPEGLLGEGALQRLKAQALAEGGRRLAHSIKPRPSYVCALTCGLPGGCEYVDLPCHAVWEALRRQITVRVSGCSEGRPKNVVREGPGLWFATNETESPLPWVELNLPANVTLLHLVGYTFAHGHHKPNFYRMRFWRTQVSKQSCKRPGAVFMEVQTKSAMQGNGLQRVRVLSKQAFTPPSDWSVVRLVGTGPQQDGAFRLALKGLKLYGMVRVNLLRQRDGLYLRQKAIEQALATDPLAPAQFPEGKLS